MRAFMSDRQTYRTTLPGNVAEYRTRQRTAVLWPTETPASEDALAEARAILSETEPINTPSDSARMVCLTVRDLRPRCLPWDLALAESLATFVSNPEMR